MPNILARLLSITLITAGLVASSLLIDKAATSENRSYVIGNKFYLNGVISTGSLDALDQLLFAATKEDTIYIFIDSPGGNSRVGFNTARAMQLSDAKRIVAVVKEANSMAGFIALEADQTLMPSGSKLMIHYGSYKLPLMKEHIFTKADLENKYGLMYDYITHLDKYMHTQHDWLLTTTDWGTIHRGGMVWKTDKDFVASGGLSFNGRQVNNPALVYLASY